MEQVPASRGAAPDSGLLRCPHCHRPLARDERTWRCDEGHTFDVARQGYVNLAAGRAVHGGDTARMLDARTSVLEAGHLDVVTDAVTAACDGLPPGALVEVGAGPAHHLARVRRRLGPRRGVALDVSAAAAKRAARVDPRWITAVVADAWGPWPLLDGVAAAVLVIFAPRNHSEAARVLVPDGRVVVVTPARDHLAELVSPLGLLEVEAGKEARLAEQARAELELVDTREVRAPRLLDRPAAGAVAAMGPSGHHLDPDALTRRVAALPAQVEVTIAVNVSRFRPVRRPRS
jgi:23S rRNA (guanine745-N1)-methyltransferase